LAVSAVGRVTGQLAPPSSTGPAATAVDGPGPLLATAATVPPIARTATASERTAERIFERLDLMITWTLLPTRNGETGVAITPESFRAVYRNKSR
jgi:hypothetical protein